MSDPLETFLIYLIFQSTLHFQRNMTQTYYLIVEDTPAYVYLKLHGGRMLQQIFIE